MNRAKSRLIGVNPMTHPVALEPGNELQLAIPRAALGLKPGETQTAIDFKRADNLRAPGDVMDFYTSGSVAPPARLNFRYTAI